jgi:hypothetical protein
LGEKLGHLVSNVDGEKLAWHCGQIRGAFECCTVIAYWRVSETCDIEIVGESIPDFGNRLQIVALILDDQAKTVGHLEPCAIRAQRSVGAQKTVHISG